METIYIHDKAFVPFIPASRVSEIIDALASRLNDDFIPVYGVYTDGPHEDTPVFLCVLNGAVMFTAGLIGRLRFPLQLASIKLSSYVGTRSTGEVRETQKLTCDVKGRTVVICEDIVDTGNTIAALKEKLLADGAREVKICTMLLKPEVFKDRIALDYVGAEIPNAFVVGFGLDYDEQGRNLEDIYVLKQ